MIVLTENEKQLFDYVLSIAKENFNEYGKHIYTEDELLAKLKFLSKEGYMKMLCSEEYGGLNLEVRSSIIVILGIAKVNPQIAHLVAGINYGVTYPIFQYGTKEQKEQYLREVEDESIGLMAFNEPNGASYGNIDVTIQKCGNGFLLNGTKSMITDAMFAKYGLIFVREPETDEYDFVIVDMEKEGVSLSKTEDTMGCEGVKIADIFFKDVQLGTDSILGDKGKGFEVLSKGIELVRVGNAVVSLAIARMAYEQTLSYVKNRKIAGTAMIDLQTIKHKLADMKMKINVMEWAVSNLITDYPLEKDNLIQVSSIKYVASENAKKICDSCLQMFGGSAYTKQMLINQLYRDIRLMPIIGGTTETLLETVGNRLR